MQKYVTGGYCSDCGTWSKSGIPIGPDDCHVCVEFNGVDIDPSSVAAADDSSNSDEAA